MGRIRLDLAILLMFSSSGVVLITTDMAIVGAILLTILVVAALATLASFQRTYVDIAYGRPAPGIYSLGVEMPMYPVYTARLFIPWSEMTDAWVKRSRMGDDVLYISVKGSRWKWRVPGRLFGEEAMMAVVHRAKEPLPTDVAGPDEDVPPKLVIYSAAGARSEMVQEDP